VINISFLILVLTGARASQNVAFDLNTTDLKEKINSDSANETSFMFMSSKAYYRM